MEHVDEEWVEDVDDRDTVILPPVGASDITVSHATTLTRTQRVTRKNEPVAETRIEGISGGDAQEKSSDDEREEDGSAFIQTLHLGGGRCDVERNSVPLIAEVNDDTISAFHFDQSFDYDAIPHQPKFSDVESKHTQ
eukprot:TRINITY_DN2895_c0_g1_i1.p1 TRINITY_DN2895_c0_g1~~TRINITY_DN2895_c0_g1_i1.p1  ORF type:complete len:137 (+),score=31.77 TRINITY_DN2895_c0_g1_i1:92-502(+)